MVKRQTIILIAMGLAILYGAYSLTTALTARHDAPDPKTMSADLQSFVMQTAVKIGKEAPSTYDIYVAGRAGNGWGRNPFSGPVLTAALGSTEKGSQRPLFVYNGYIESGKHQVAVINNSEYLIGEPLEKEGYFVKRISASRVVIENRREKTEFEVPVSE